MQKVYVVRLTDQERDELEGVVKKLKATARRSGVLRLPLVCEHAPAA